VLKREKVDKHDKYEYIETHISFQDMQTYLDPCKLYHNEVVRENRCTKILQLCSPNNHWPVLFKIEQTNLLLSPLLMNISECIMSVKYSRFLQLKKFVFSWRVVLIVLSNIEHHSSSPVLRFQSGFFVISVIYYCIQARFK